MHRRDFLTISATLMATASGTRAGAQTPAAAKTPEFYMWRQYVLRTGTQPRRLADFLQNAAIPALNRLGHSPIGVFEVTFGLPSPTIFVLTPSTSLESLISIEAGLERDEAFMKSADAYLNAPATDPVYVRQEVSLLTAFPAYRASKCQQRLRPRDRGSSSCGRTRATTSAHTAPRSACSRRWARLTSSAAAD